MFKQFKKLFDKKSYETNSYLYQLGSAKWMNRDYTKFAEEAYIKNVIAHRAINIIAQSAASVPLKLFKKMHDRKTEIFKHNILDLINSPNPSVGGKEFLESIYSYKQISGNAFLLATLSSNEIPQELFALRPDRVKILPSSNFVAAGYVYQVGEHKQEFRVNPITGCSQILHLKNFNPLSDWYGLSSIEAAAYSIDQHNQAGQWNQSLLQNGARPSGAFIVRSENGNNMSLTPTQYSNLKKMVSDVFSGPQNAGKPLLLEGGLDWKELSLSPKDMDFISSKHSSARDIALALGLPPQLLGIPGDNTYSNLSEARLAFWEQTVIPLVDNVISNLSQWLQSFYGKEYKLSYDLDNVPALSARREAHWNRINNCSFMTDEEKRVAVGLSSKQG